MRSNNTGDVNGDMNTVSALPLGIPATVALLVLVGKYFNETRLAKRDARLRHVLRIGTVR